MQRTAVPSIGVVAAVTLFATGAMGQETPARLGLGLAAQAGYVDFGGEAFSRIEGALGVEVSARFTWPSNFQLAGGVHYSSHGVADASSKLDVWAAFLDARYIFAMVTSQRVAPYFGGRAGYVRQSFIEGSVNEAVNGATFGGEVGVLFEIVPHLAVDAFAYFGGLILGAPANPNFPFDSEDTNGNMSIAQVGLVYTFGG